MTVPDPQYITEQEVKDQTKITNLKNLSTSDVTDLIQTAEDMIDAYVGPQEHHPDDAVTDRVFPRIYDVDSQGDAEVPYKVSRAALRQVEWLYAEWWTDNETQQLPIEFTVDQFSAGGDGTYSEKRSSVGNEFEAATLAPLAKALLKPFVSRFVGVDVTNPDLVPLPS